MSIVSDIFKELYSKAYYHKGMRVNIFGLPVLKHHKFESLKATVYRLKKEGLINNDNNGWFITQNGKSFLKTHKRFKKFDSIFSEKAAKDLLVIFDIPQGKRAERDWLRWQLRKFGYMMIQRSVWVGPSPLPTDFKKYVEEIKIKNDIKTFKLTKGYTFDH